MSLTRKLFELQQIDLAIAKKQETLNDIKSQLGETEALSRIRIEYNDVKSIYSEVMRQKREVEWEIEDLQKSINNLNAKLYGGKINNPKELLSIEQEKQSFVAKLRQKEDKELDLMSEEEGLQNKVSITEEQLRKIEDTWHLEQSNLEKMKTSIQADIEVLDKDRGLSVNELDAQTIKLYEGLKLRKGQAVVKVEQGRCQGCRINLPISEWQRVKSGKLVQCGSCSKILFLG